MKLKRDTTHGLKGSRLVQSDLSMLDEDLNWEGGPGMCT